MHREELHYRAVGTGRGQRASDIQTHFPHLELSSMLLLVLCPGDLCRPGYRLGTSAGHFTNWGPLQALLHVEQLSGSFQNVSKHSEEVPAGDWGLASQKQEVVRAALPSALGKHFPGKTEVALGPGPFSLLLPCLPQSENASSEEAGGGEYVNLYSSGQTSEELAPSGGVSNLSGWPCAWAGHCPPQSRFPCSCFYWLSPCRPAGSQPVLWERTWLPGQGLPCFCFSECGIFQNLADESPRNHWTLAQPQLLPGISSHSSLSADPLSKRCFSLLPFFPACPAALSYSQGSKASDGSPAGYPHLSLLRAGSLLGSGGPCLDYATAQMVASHCKPSIEQAAFQIWL